MTDNPEAELIAEQLRHTIDLLRSEIKELRQSVEHQRDFMDHRLANLENDARDHEGRIRSLTDGVTQFKMFAGLANGGSGILSIIAVVKSFFLS